MILGYDTLMKIGPELLEPFNPNLVNPASIDIRIGRYLKLEDKDSDGNSAFMDVDLQEYSQENPFIVYPEQLILVETFESIRVPTDLAVELKLKSSIARKGWDHALAFYFDPGWRGIGTLELKNNTRYAKLPIWIGMKIGQLIYHRLDQVCSKPYAGKYQGATSVEISKPDKA